MRALIILLSVLLIFAGIGAVLYVNIESDNELAKIESRPVNAEVKNDIFSKRQSIKEIDSITSAINYPYTIHNAVVKVSPDSGKGMNTAKRI